MLIYNKDADLLFVTNILFAISIFNVCIHPTISIIFSLFLLFLTHDFNTFDFVIECLVDICHHEPLQAEQCTLIVHYNGKCAVKVGSYTDLNPMRVALADRGLSVVIA